MQGPSGIRVRRPRTRSRSREFLKDLISKAPSPPPCEKHIFCHFVIFVFVFVFVFSRAQKWSKEAVGCRKRADCLVIPKFSRIFASHIIYANVFVIIIVIVAKRIVIVIVTQGPDWI